MADFTLSKTEKYLTGLTILSAGISISMVISQYKRHAEYLYLKSKADDAAAKADAAIKTVSAFDGMLKKEFSKATAPAQKVAQR